MKKYIISILMLAAASLMAAGQNSEAVYNKLSEKFVVNGDGSSEYTYHKELTLNSHRSFDSMYGETFIVYNPQWQTIKINESYTIQADGSKTVTPENAFNEVLPSNAADAPAYNGIKELVVTHTGTELGCTIVLDYTITTKPGFMAGTDFYRQMTEYSPIREYIVTLSSPDEYEVRQTIDPKVRGTVSGNTVTYTFKNIPEMYPESNVALSSRPYIFFSAKKDGRAGEISSAIEKAAVSLPSWNGEATLDGIEKYVGSEIASSGIPLSAAGLVRDSRTVVGTAYGTEAEKAALAMSLLKKAGLPAALELGFQEGRPESILTLSNIYVKSGDRYLGKTPAKESVEVNVVKEVTAEELGAKADAGYSTCTLPALQEGADAWRLQVLNSQRREDFEVPSKLSEKVTYKVDCKGYNIDTKAFDKALENSVGSVRLTCAEEGDTLVFTRSINIGKKVIPAAEYSSFRALMNLWNDPIYKTVVLKK